VPSQTCHSSDTPESGSISDMASEIEHRVRTCFPRCIVCDHRCRTRGPKPDSISHRPTEFSHSLWRWVTVICLIRTPPDRLLEDALPADGQEELHCMRLGGLKHDYRPIGTLVHRVAGRGKLFIGGESSAVQNGWRRGCPPRIWSGSVGMSGEGVMKETMRQRQNCRLGQTC
jgi:hypothetical protein